MKAVTYFDKRTHKSQVAQSCAHSEIADYCDFGLWSLAVEQLMYYGSDRDELRDCRRLEIAVGVTVYF